MKVWIDEDYGMILRISKTSNYGQELEISDELYKNYCEAQEKFFNAEGEIWKVLAEENAK